MHDNKIRIANTADSLGDPSGYFLYYFRELLFHSTAPTRDFYTAIVVHGARSDVPDVEKPPNYLLRSSPLTFMKVVAFRDLTEKNIHCVWEKRSKCYCNIIYKTRAILMKCGTLPEHLRQITSIDLFKRPLKTFLFGQISRSAH